jgi:hypothetical protein
VTIHGEKVFMRFNRGKAAIWWAAVLLAVSPEFCCAEGDIDQTRLNAADSEPENWLTLGRK